jgi:alginate O-acetyltransferase complex protein AlgI
MLLIGLWHGVTWNFVLWGMWHGLGLFVQNRWSERIKPWFAARPLSPNMQKALQIAGVLLTFHYVALGWVLFVLPTPAMAGQMLLRLAGAAW